MGPACICGGGTCTGLGLGLGLESRLASLHLRRRHLHGDLLAGHGAGRALDGEHLHGDIWRFREI